MGLREAHLAATRERLLRAAVEVIEAGVEPTMRAIAQQARVGERTLYRYFPTREALEQAVSERLSGRIGAEPPASTDGLEDYVERLFGAFSGNRELLETVVSARWVRQTYKESRPRNLAAFEDMIEASFPEVPPEERRAAAAALRVPLSGEGFMYLVDCGFDDEAIVAQGKWLVRQIVDTLKRARTRARRRARG